MAFIRRDTTDANERRRNYASTGAKWKCQFPVFVSYVEIESKGRLRVARKLRAARCNAIPQRGNWTARAEAARWRG